MRLAIIAALALGGCAGIKHVPESEGNFEIIQEMPCCPPVVPGPQPSFPPRDGLPKDIDGLY